MANLPDIDIDFADRTHVLKHIHGTPARLNTGKQHNTGVYFTDIPVASDGIATLDHETAEELGYFKLDLLNVSVYEHVRDEMHLIDLMHTEPDWSRLWTDREYCERVIHIGNHYELVNQMRPDSIARMAMLLAVIRPGKAHLRGKDWATVAESVWQRPTENVFNSYFFKKSHSVSYAHLVVVHMNILASA
jgi:hypothetical protein